MSIGQVSGRSSFHGNLSIPVILDENIPGSKAWWAKIHSPPSPAMTLTAEDVAYGEWWMLELYNT
jgi:hypothetical protein